MLGQEKLGKWAHLLGFASCTGIDLPGESAGLIPNPEWKRSRAASANSRLPHLKMELDCTLEEMENIRHVMEQEQVESSSGGREYLEALKAQAEELGARIAAMEVLQAEAAWVPGDTRNMAIGQGNVLVSVLQMAQLSAMIANDGRLPYPHLLLNSGGNRAEFVPPVSKSTLAFLRDAMHRVVFGAQGTARQKELRLYDVAAKTGTAEVGENINNGWIVGFAPCSRPRVAFAVVIERTELHGGDVAGPVLARILEAYFEEEAGKSPGD
jgi:penicillin-binding protein 2